MAHEITAPEGAITVAEGEITTPEGTEESEAKTSEVKLNAKQVTFFNRQLASMAKLDMPLASGLRVMAEEVTDPVFVKVITGIQRDLEEGVPLVTAVF